MAAKTKARGASTVRDMVLSLLVVGAAIAVFVLLLPKTPHQKVTPVPYLPAARALAQSSPLPIIVPDPLPTGWQSNYVRVGGAPDALHVGFVLDSKRFARLDETAKADAAYYRDSHVGQGAPSAAPSDPAQQPPAGYEIRRDGSHVALLRHVGGGILTLSDGGTSSGASLAELVTLARSLRQLPG